MTKPTIELNLGRETSEHELEEILEAFSPYFDVSYKRNIVRLSADLLPLIIDFTVGAIGSGVTYDALKGALIALQQKFQTTVRERNPAARVHVKRNTFIVSDSRISLQSVDAKLNFSSVEEFIEYLKSSEE